jgi:hypothetical protein
MIIIRLDPPGQVTLPVVGCTLAFVRGSSDSERSEGPWVDDPGLSFVEPSSHVLTLPRVLVERVALRTPDQDHPSVGVRTDLSYMAEVAVLVVSAVTKTTPGGLRLSYSDTLRSEESAPTLGEYVPR